MNVLKQNRFIYQTFQNFFPFISLISSFMHFTVYVYEQAQLGNKNCLFMSLLYLWTKS